MLAKNEAQVIFSFFTYLVAWGSFIKMFISIKLSSPYSMIASSMNFVWFADSFCLISFWNKKSKEIDYWCHFLVRKTFKFHQTYLTFKISKSQKVKYKIKLRTVSLELDGINLFWMWKNIPASWACSNFYTTIKAIPKCYWLEVIHNLRRQRIGRDPSPNVYTSK